jgi:hypothetical protein
MMESKLFQEKRRLKIVHNEEIRNIHRPPIIFRIALYRRLSLTGLSDQMEETKHAYGI